MKRKIEVEPIENTVDVFVSHCFRNHQPMAINPYFDEVYEINGKSYKFTNDVLNSMIESGKVKLLNVNEIHCNIVGISNI